MTIHFNTTLGQAATAEQSLDEPVGNIIVKLQKILQVVSIAFARIEQQGERLDILQRNYLELTKESADLMRKTGNFAPFITGMNFLGLIGVQLALPGMEKKEMRDMSTSLVNQIPQVSSMFTSGWSAQIKQKDNASSLELQKYIEKAGKKQSEGSNKQEFIKVLEAAQQSLTAASRGP